MLQAFQQLLQEDLVCLQDRKLLLACSGGLDSMVLTDLCLKSHLNIHLAHCNFSLRSEESDEDQQFVVNYANELQLPCFTKVFDTIAFAKANKCSTQMAARDLRYEWFAKLATQNEYDFILTGHHANDNLETFLINLGRGTGLNGLIGIPQFNERIVRPLLSFSRKQIHEYALHEKLKWREDSSNEGDAYQRNHLRHHAIPKWEEAQPSLLQGFANSQAYLRQSAALLAVYQDQLRASYLKPYKNAQALVGQEIDLKMLKQHPHPSAVLYVLLQEYGFTAWEDVYALCEAQSGKQVLSDSHQLLRDREALLLFARGEKSIQSFEIAHVLGEQQGAFGRIELQEVDGLTNLNPNEIIVDRNRLRFPLTLRRWKEGDSFYPLGMQGKKKLSKYFKDEKVSLVAKDYIWLLCSDEDIVWIVNHRADDRFKVNEQTTDFLKIIYTQ